MRKTREYLKKKMYNKRGTSEEDEDERDLKSYWIQKVNCSWIEIIHLF